MDTLDIIKLLHKETGSTLPLMKFAQKMKRTLAATSVPKVSR